MAWESRLTGFQEVPGSTNPVVFRYPARTFSALIFAFSAFFLTFAAVASTQKEAFSRWFMGVPLGLGGIAFFSFGCRQLLVLRRIDLYEQARQIVVIRQLPFGRPARQIHDFTSIRLISVSRNVGAESGDYFDTIVVEMKDGSHVDFGNYSGEEGGRLAARLHALTGASVGK